MSISVNVGKMREQKKQHKLTSFKRLFRTSSFFFPFFLQCNWHWPLGDGSVLCRFEMLGWKELNKSKFNCIHPKIIIIIILSLNSDFLPTSNWFLIEKSNKRGKESLSNQDRPNRDSLSNLFSSKCHVNGLYTQAQAISGPDSWHCRGGKKSLVR